MELACFQICGIPFRCKSSLTRPYGEEPLQDGPQDGRDHVPSPFTGRVGACGVLIGFLTWEEVPGGGRSLAEGGAGPARPG